MMFCVHEILFSHSETFCLHNCEERTNKKTIAPKQHGVTANEFYIVTLAINITLSVYFSLQHTQQTSLRLFVCNKFRK